MHKLSFMSALERLGLSPENLRESPALAAVSESQSQTREAFGFKWTRRESYESSGVEAYRRKWMLERYCGGDGGLLDDWLSGDRRLILDAGCGAGQAALLFFGRRLADHDYLGVDISEAVEVARRRFADEGVPGEFLQADFTTLPIPDGSLDMVFAEGVLHHADSTREALVRLSRALRGGGRFLFYVYAKKAPIREFTDDLIRERLKGLTDEEAWDALRPLTRLGKALGETGAEIEVPEDIPYLGVKKGRYDLQRFVYYHIVKAFYRADFSFEEMNHNNFDWFRPLNCHRHTPEEVRSFCEEAGLEIETFREEPSGITVVARKR